MQENQEVREMEQEVQGTEQEVQGTEPLEQTARRDFSRVGLWLVFATILFNGMQYLAIVIYSAIQFAVSHGDAAGDGTGLGTLTWVQLLPAYLIAVPLILHFGKKLPGTVPEKKGIKPLHFVGAWACCIGIAISCNILGLIITAIIGRLMGITVQNVSAELISGMDPLAGVFLASIGAPVCEELIFRKTLITKTLKYGEGVAVLLSGLAFGLFHGNFNQFAYTFGLGLFLAYVFVKTGDVKVTIALHACVNFFSSVVLTGLLGRLDVATLSEYLNGAGTMSPEDRLALLVPYVTEHMGLILTIGLVMLFEYGMAIAGIILILANLKKFRVSAGEVTIPKGKRFFLIFCNLGMGLFLLIWILRIVAQILGWF